MRDRGIYITLLVTFRLFYQPYLATHWAMKFTRHLTLTRLGSQSTWSEVKAIPNGAFDSNNGTAAHVEA